MSWIEEYQGILEHLFYEPNLIGRSKGTGPFKNHNDMWLTTSEREVPLNHLLNIFFSLVPLEKLGIGVPDDTYTMVSNSEIDTRIIATSKMTQPDLIFEGNRNTVSLELKTTSKSSALQALKYAVFNHLTGRIKDGKNILLYLTPYSEITKVFDTPYANITELKSAMREAENARIKGAEYGYLIESLEIKFITFREFCENLVNNKAFNDTEKRLADALNTFLRTRRYY